MDLRDPILISLLENEAYQLTHVWGCSSETFCILCGIINGMQLNEFLLYSSFVYFDFKIFNIMRYMVFML